MTPTPELSRRITARSLGTARPGEPGIEVTVEATPQECERLARRLALPSIATFTCRFRLSAPDAAGQVAADGLLSARLEQTCVVSLEDFPTSVAEQFTVRFVPADRGSGPAELELDLEADDDISYEGGLIDLGEAATEQLALALDPYPRKPGLDRPAGLGLGDPPPGASDAAPGEGADQDHPDDAAAPARPNPFAALARLRRAED